MYVSHSKLGWADVMNPKELLKKSAIPHTCVTVNPRRVLIFFEKSQFSFFIDFSIGKFFEKNVGRKKVSQIKINSRIPPTYVTVNPRRVFFSLEKSKFSFFIDFSIGKCFGKNVGWKKIQIFIFHWLFHRKMFRKKMLVEKKFPLIIPIWTREGKVPIWKLLTHYVLVISTFKKNTMP